MKGKERCFQIAKTRNHPIVVAGGDDIKVRLDLTGCWVCQNSGMIFSIRAYGLHCFFINGLVC